MTLTLEIDHEKQTRLETLARNAGFSVQDYVRRVVDQAADQEGAGAEGPVTSPAERAAQFQAWADGHGHDTPLLTDDAISREAIYSRQDDHGAWGRRSPRAAGRDRVLACRDLAGQRSGRLRLDAHRGGRRDQAAGDALPRHQRHAGHIRLVAHACRRRRGIRRKRI